MDSQRKCTYGIMMIIIPFLGPETTMQSYLGISSLPGETLVWVEGNGAGGWAKTCDPHPVTHKQKLECCEKPVFGVPCATLTRLSSVQPQKMA